VGERTIRFGQSVPAILFLALAMASPVRCKQASDASLTIRFASGQTQFHVGEVIPLELAFTAWTEHVYEMDMRNYDRSGRLNLEQFHVSPPSRDPLDNYYNGGVFGGFIGGGLSSGPRYLGREPQIIHEDLNEWIAVDRPGQYAIYVTSRRVSRHDGSKLLPVELRSNTLYFDVVEAGPGWQAETLGSATAELDDSESTPEERRSALCRAVA
jgi:hypothetical protein